MPESTLARGRVERGLTLTGRLIRLSAHARSVADVPRPDAASRFASAVVAQLALVLDAAEVQADELEMLRAQAADRERVRGVLQAVAAEVERLDAALSANRSRPASAVVSAQWALERIRDLMAPAGPPESIGNLGESR